MPIHCRNYAIKLTNSSFFRSFVCLFVCLLSSLLFYCVPFRLATWNGLAGWSVVCLFDRFNVYIHFKDDKSIAAALRISSFEDLIVETMLAHQKQNKTKQ